MATIDDILKKYQKALTKKQIEDLIQKSEQYKLLNAGNRANAQTQLAKQYRQTRRGLQNVGLAGREGKLISGREISVKDAYRNAYGTYNQQLQQGENAMIEQAAAKKAAANARARQQQAEQQQKAIEYEQERLNQEQITDPRLEREKPTREDKEYSALVNYNPFNHSADENVNYYLKIAEQNGMKGVEANRYAVSMAAEVANRKGAAAEAIQPHGLKPNQEQIQKNLPSLRFAQDYGVNLMKLKQEDPAMAQTIEDDVKYWYDFIDEKSEFWSNAIRNKTKDYHSALQMQANAYAALAKLSLAAKAPAEQRQYYLMSDAEFDTAYDAAERAYTRAEQEYQIAKKDSSSTMDDVISEPKAALEKAMQMKNLMDQIKANRASNSTVNLLAYQMQIPESAKTKDKEYASTREYVDENQAAGKITLKTKDWTLKINPWTENPSQNWAAVRDIGWSADDFARTHDVKGSRYSALINEWSLICGRIASLFGANQYFATDKDFVGASLDYIQALFGANRADTDVNYKWFRDQCLMAFRGNYDDTGSDAQKEQMDAMLTLANLMTDEERARFNALLDTMGARAADEYFDLLYKTVLPERFTSYVSDYNAEYMEDLPGIAKPALSVTSVLPSLTQGIPGIAHAYSTNQQDPAAARVSAMRYNQAQNIRNARMQKFGKFGQFAYGTTMSMWDSYFVAAITGGLGKAFAAAGVPTAVNIGGKTVNIAEKAASVIGGSLLGASAYNSTYQEGLERGLTPEKARMTALGSGINEMLFESLSLDMLVGHFQKGGMLKASKKAFVNWIVNTLVQGGVEGSEEVFTDIGNNLWDKMVNGIYSEELTKIREYVSQGMTLEEAKRKVSGEFAAQLGMSFGGGFASGGVMGGGSTFMGMVQNRGNEKVGKSLDSGLRSKIDGFQFKDKQMQELQKQSKKTNQDYGVLLQGYLAEKYGQFEGNVQQAVKDGTITNEDAALLDKWQKGEVTADEMQTVNETLAKLDIKPLLEIAQAQESIRFNQQVGVKNAENLRAWETKHNEAQKQHDEEVAKIEADDSLTDAQKEQKKAEAYQKMTEAQSRAGDELSAKVGRKIDIKVEKDGTTVRTKKGSGKVTFDFSTYNNGKAENHNTVETMTERERAALRIAQVVAALNGTNIKVEAQFTSRTLKDGTVEDLKDKNGYYDEDTDTIHVNLNGTNSVLWTISHELTHRLATMNKKGYAELHDAIKTELTKENLTYSEVQTLEHSYQIDKLQTYLNKGMNLWDALVAYETDRGYKGAAAEEEVIARCCEQFLAKTTFINSFANKHFRTARSVSAFLTRMNADMQQLFSDVNMRSTRAATTRNELGYFETWNTDVSPEQDILNQVDTLDDIARKWENAVKMVDQKRKAKESAKAESVKASTMDKSWVSSYPSTRIDYKEKSSYSPYMQHVITEYMGAVDDRLVQFAKKVVNGQYVKPVELKNVSNELGADIEKLLGWNPAGYKTIIESRIGEHIRKRHGLGGYVSGRQSDMSMADYNDFARMQFIIDNYDTIQVGKATTAYREMQPGSDNVQLKAETIVLGKRINSMYYVAEAIPNTSDKTVAIMSAYIRDVDVTKKGAVPVRDTKYVPRSTSKTEAALTPKPIIHDREAEYNSKLRKNSTQDKDFHLTQRAGEQRVFEMRGTTANVYGSSVELEGGTLLNRVRMMQNLAEMYGSVTVTATSEKEAQAFEKAGAQREADTFGNTKYGTWAFEHQEDQYRKDTEYDAKQKRNFANAVMKEVGTYRNFSKDDMRIIRAKLEKAFAVLHNAWHGDGDQLVAWEYADRLFDQILNRYTEMTEADAEMREAILAEMPRKTDAKGRVYREIEVTAAQMAEIRTAYESVAEYNRALSKALGTRVVVKETENAQTLEDVFASNPYLDAQTNEGDMPMVLLDRAQETVGKRTNPYKAESAERAALKEAMFEKALGIVGIEKSTTQKVREAVREARAEERAKAKEEAEKKKLAEQMERGRFRAKVRREEHAWYENVLNKMKEVKYSEDEQVKKDFLKIAKTNYQRLVNMLANPTEASHIPVQLARQVSEFCLALNDLMDADMSKKADSLADAKMSKRGVINMDKLIDAYKQTFADKDTIEQATRENPGYDPRGSFLDMSMYDETLVQMMEGLNELLKGKTVKQMDNYELRALMYTVRGVLNAVYDANKATVKGEKRFVYKIAEKMVSELQKANVFGKKQNAITRFLNQYTIESLGLRRIAKIYSNSDENSEFVKLVDDLNEGAIEVERIALALRKMFDPVTTRYAKDMKTWYGKNAEWIDIGNGVKITKGMRVSLAMHLLNEQNLRNLTERGVTIPNQADYKRGDYEQAYTNGTIVRMTKEQAKKIVSEMTEAEKAYFEVAKEFFHKRAGYYINRTSLKMLGYAKAIVENYFPIQVDDAYKMIQYDAKTFGKNAAVEHPGFLESRKGTSNVMYLNDITAVVNRQINGVAKYAGLAIPMRNWNAVMNQWMWHEDANKNWVADKGNVHTELKKQMGVAQFGKSEQGRRAMVSFVDQFIEDLAGASINNANEYVSAATLGQKLTSNYVKAVLTLNARVALSQLASVPTAAAEIPWKYIVQSFGGNVEQHLNRNASNELIDMYTPLFAMRRAGTQTEVSEVMKRKGLSEKAEQKLPWALGWITAMDTAATRRLWYACERWVKGETNIPVGSDEFYKEVAKRYERVIQNTQPNFTVLQRSPALRSKNAAARIITMFGTQRMQNAGVFIESAAEVIQAKDKATRKAALKKFGRTLSGLVTAAIVIGLERAIVSAIRGRMKPLQDKDKDVTRDSVDKYIRGEIGKSLAGSFMYVGEIYDFVNGIVSGFTDNDTYDQSFALPASEAISEIIKFCKDAIPFMLNINAVDENGKPKYDDHQKWLKTKTFINGLMTVASYSTGLPFANASKTLLNGIHPGWHDIVDAFKTGELIPWLHQSGRLDSASTAANYKEWTNLGKKGSTYFYWEKKYKEIKGDKNQPNVDTLASKLMADRDLTPEEKATLYRMLAGDLVQDGSVVYHPITVNQKLKDKERGTIAIDFTNSDRYAMSQMGDAKYNGFLKAVEMGVPEDIAATAYRNYASAKKYETRRGVDAKDSFHDWLFKIVSDPAHRAILDMQVVGKTASVDGAIGYKKNGEVYADYSSKDTFDAYLTGGKKADKAEAMGNLEGTPQQKAEAFASRYSNYTAKGAIVYNDKGEIQADYTSDEALKASQMGTAHYAKYTTAVKNGMSKENALKAVEMHKEITSDDDKDNATQATKWIFNTYKSANDRAIAGQMFTTKDVTVKNGRTYDENGYIYRDYTSVAWYKLSNRTLSKDGKNKRYETAQTLTKQGYTAEQVVATYVELDKLSKKSEWQKYLKGHGYNEEQIHLFLWSRGWAK